MMRIPPHYMRSRWQRFFAGMIIGMIFGWGFFLYEFGTVQEKLVTQIKKHESTIKDQKQSIEILRSDQDEMNKDNLKKLTVQEVKVYFKNDKDLKLSELSIHELRSAIENELKSVKSKNIETIANSKDLLFQTLENKTFVINDKRYQVSVKELYLFTTLEIFFVIRLAE